MTAGHLRRGQPVHLPSGPGERSADPDPLPRSPLSAIRSPASGLLWPNRHGAVLATGHPDPMTDTRMKPLFAAILLALALGLAVAAPVGAQEAMRFAVTDIDGLKALQCEMGPFKAASGLKVERFPVSGRTFAVEAMAAGIGMNRPHIDRITRRRPFGRHHRDRRERQVHQRRLQRRGDGCRRRRGPQDARKHRDHRVHPVRRRMRRR